MPDVTLQQVKEAVEGINRAFEEHKKTNDARLEAIRKEKATADFDEKLDKIGETMNTLEKVQRDFHRQQEQAETKRVADELAWKTAQEEHARKMEARLNRMVLGLGGAGSIDHRLLIHLGNLGQDRLVAEGVDDAAAGEDVSGADRSRSRGRSASRGSLPRR